MGRIFARILSAYDVSDFGVCVLEFCAYDVCERDAYVVLLRETYSNCSHTCFCQSYDCWREWMRLRPMQTRGRMSAHRMRCMSQPTTMASSKSIVALKLVNIKNQLVCAPFLFHYSWSSVTDEGDRSTQRDSGLETRDESSEADVEENIPYQSTRTEDWCANVGKPLGVLPRTRGKYATVWLWSFLGFVWVVR